MKGSSDNFRPIWVGDIELSGRGEVDPLSPRAQEEYDLARILVRLHGVPLGFLQLRLTETGLDGARTRTAAWDALREPIVRHLESVDQHPRQARARGSSGRRALSSGRRG